MLIAFEGVDKSGKETQANLLIDRLRREHKNAKKVEFPNYQSEASGAVKMYLNGDFGENPDEVNPYAASVFFAVDRYASYKTEWNAFHQAGGIIVADRYTMSNMIHQGAKFTDALERQKFIEWLIDLEFVKIGLPKPDIVIFLDLSMVLRTKLLEKELNDKIKTGTPDVLTAVKMETPAARLITDIEKPIIQPIISGAHTPKRGGDIHERDLEYLRRAHICAREIAAQFGWKRINAEHGGVLRPALDIHEEIYETIAPFIAMK